MDPARAGITWNPEEWIGTTIFRDMAISGSTLGFPKVANRRPVLLPALLVAVSEAASNQGHNFKSWAISPKKVKIYSEFDDALRWRQWRSVELKDVMKTGGLGWSAIPAHMGLVLSIKVLAAICLSWPAFVPAPRGSETNGHELRWTIRSPSWQHFRANWWQMIANGWIDSLNEWMNLDESLVGSRRAKSFYCHCQFCGHIGDDLPQKRFSWQEQTPPTVCKSRHRQLGHGVAPQDPMGPMVSWCFLRLWPPLLGHWPCKP